MGVISIGCTISSPVIANAKSEGHVDYIRALPIPRILISLADLCIWLIAILPGVFILCYTGLSSLFCPIKCVNSGCFRDVSYLSNNDQSRICNCLYFFSQNIVTLMSQLILMIGLMFSPIMYPASRLPDWINHLYHVLPFVPSVNLLRACVYGHDRISLFDFTILIIWILLTQLLILRVLYKEK